MRSSIVCKVLLFFAALNSCCVSTSESPSSTHWRNSSEVAVEFPTLAKADEPNVKDIIQKVVRKYHAIRKYRAGGINVYQSEILDEKVEVKTEFSIDYSSPSQMKIDWIDEGKQMTFLAVPGQATIMSEGNVEKSFDDVMWGISSASSGGRSSYRFEIGNILLGKERSLGELPSFTLLKELELIGKEEIDGKACFIVQGIVNDDSLVKISYWIDKETFLIKRYERLMLSAKNSKWFFKTTETYFDTVIAP